MILKLILAPVLGGVIGYITNDLAIRMLFRPRKAVYIGKLHVPFTPGLIPQQKERIAASIGAWSAVNCWTLSRWSRRFYPMRCCRRCGKKLTIFSAM